MRGGGLHNPGLFVEKQMCRATSQLSTTTIRVENVTRGSTLVSRGEVADTPWRRMRGLLGRRDLAKGEGLLIVPCNSIHTFFMRFAIDVLYIDSAGVVIGLQHALRPWRLGQFQLRSRCVLELQAGTLRATGTQLGDQLEIVGYNP